jgi:hypothetical protein
MIVQKVWGRPGGTHATLAAELYNVGSNQDK